ncbi:MAG: hypothetical protein JOZ69_12445 [Myxococcales bacterium]|nr:hypothetical protein [Myxococcales bacterium]
MDGGGPDVVSDSTTDVIVDHTAPDVMAEGGGDGRSDADAGPDARDAAPEADARSEAGDARPDGDAARGDADAGLGDAEAGVDADARPGDADAAPGDADAGPGDADAEPLDADASDGGLPPGLVTYPDEYALAICTGFANCCGAATFDLATCESQITSQGYDVTLPLSRNVYTRGHLAFNATQAAACKAALMAWPCGATLSSAQNQAILSACHGVLEGTIPINGTGCTDSFECAAGAYCNGTPTAPGTCVALAGDGNACVPGNASVDEQCTQLATALPAEYCNVYPADGGAPGTGTCAPAQATSGTALCFDGMNFTSDYACTSQACNVNTKLCDTSLPNTAAPGTGISCQAFVLPGGG